MSKAIIDKERCKACGLCVEYCPKKALKMADDININGYKYTLLIEEKCIGCGICYTVCPDGVFTITD